MGWGRAGLLHLTQLGLQANQPGVTEVPCFDVALVTLDKALLRGEQILGRWSQVSPLLPSLPEAGSFPG